jgi:hypothetical protein
MHNFSLVQNSILTPTLLNQVTLGVNYFLQTFNDANTSFNPIALGLNTGVTDPTLIGRPKITINGFDYVGATQPLGRIDTTGHITDNLTWLRGRHQLRLGGEYRGAPLDVFYQINKRGSFVFDGTAVHGRRYDAERQPASSPISWRVSHQFERRDYRAGRLQRDYTRTRSTGGRTIQIASRPTQSELSACATPTMACCTMPRQHRSRSCRRRASPVPGRDWIRLSQGLNNFAPRIRLRLDADARNGKTVVRGAYGIFYDVPALNFFTANTGLPNGGGRESTPTRRHNPGLHDHRAQRGLPVRGPVFGSAGPSRRTGIRHRPEFPDAVRAELQLNIQRQLPRRPCSQAGYVGSLGRSWRCCATSISAQWRTAVRRSISDTRHDRHGFSHDQLELQLLSRRSCGNPSGRADGDIQLHAGPRHR